MTSSTSSVMGVSIVGGDGALIQDAGVDTETDTETETGEETDDEEGDGMRASTVTVKGHIEDPVADEESRRALRDQLRRSMSQRKDTYRAESPLQPTLSISEKAEDIEYALEGALLIILDILYLAQS